ncbi:ATP-binding protein [Algoriphagus terrigena]|uniref:ATP-binding protein n=1 Tax=Algoriphagus terrigena TaxID=344884 RepID=UPI000425D273|nr:ATP-binding protein [Algoriphagus terrigena]
MKEEEIRKQLSLTLDIEPGNYSRILELSTQLASFDNEHVRFSVDAGVIDRLGRELVARHETAVSELVKNAYDADSTYVEIIFHDANLSGGTLTLEDDGHGMTKDQLVNGFMKISSSDKFHNPISPTYKRARAGKKGIGRFATQRLGSKLTIVTQTDESLFALKIEIDWSHFDKDQNLIVISNAITEVPKERQKGTTLTISNLRETWTGAAIRRVYKYSIDVIQPFPLSKSDSSQNDLKSDLIEFSDPGFEIRCWQSINGGLEEVADSDTMIFEHALAEISGEVDGVGNGSWDISSPKLGLYDHSDISSSVRIEGQSFKHIRNVRFKAYYFIYNIGMIPKMVTGYIQQKANEAGGFRLYRNGFRVLPYGEPQNDWLGLDESLRRRVILPSHGNNNFFGFVEITDPSNITFHELSSREGLFKDAAYDELVDFVYRSILGSVLRIADFRKKKQTTGQKNYLKEERTAAEEVSDLAGELEGLADEIDKEKDDKLSNGIRTNEEPDRGSEDKNEKRNESSEDRSKRFREFAEKLRAAAESLEEIGMLRVLAGLGLTIGEFTHEIKQYLPAFDVDSEYLIDNTDEGSELQKRALRLKTSFNSFNTYASYFDETISQNVQRELTVIELRDVINRFLTVIVPDTERSSLTVSPIFSDYGLFTCKMHPSEWASILYNLYSNSKKAIKRAKILGNIRIKAGKTDEVVYLEFSDNGDGIPPENEEKVFKAFFTTSSQAGHSGTIHEEIAGTGLGLKIISDIVLSYGGEIFLSSPDEGYKTTFRIEVPIASEEEISQYDL